MDQLLAKAEPASNVRSTSVMTYFRRGETQQLEQVNENMRETTLQTPRLVKKEGVGGLQALEQRFSCSPW